MQFAGTKLFLPYTPFILTLVLSPIHSPFVADHGSIACSIPTAQASLCPHHNMDSENGSVEHEPPRRMDNEVTHEMVYEQEDMIRLLHVQTQRHEGYSQDC